MPRNKGMNVILLVSDTFRYDFLGCNGNAWIDTRDLDAFARKCLVFDNCHTGSFPTIPQRTDMVTGRFIFPYAGWQPLQTDQTTVAQYLNDAGYVTQLICDTPHLLGHGCNFFRGFDAYHWERGQECDIPLTRMNTPIREAVPHAKTRCDYKLQPKPMTQPGVPFATTLVDRHRWVNDHWRYEEDRFMARTARTAIRWLEENHKAERFFLWVDMFDAHEPWDPPEYVVRRYDPNYAGTPMLHPNYGHASDYTAADLRNLRAHYAGEITLVSKWIGQILRKVEETGLAGNTAIIFTSDHGIYVGEHDRTGKSNISPGDDRVWPLYGEVTHVPLMICVPGIKPRRVGSIAQAVDVAPTILDLAGQPIPGGLDGRPLLHVLAGTAAPHTCAISGWAPIKRERVATVHDGRHALVLAAEQSAELFDVHADPSQKRSILGKRPEVARRLYRHLASFLNEKGIDASGLFGAAARKLKV